MEKKSSPETLAINVNAPVLNARPFSSNAFELCHEWKMTGGTNAPPAMRKAEKYETVIDLGSETRIMQPV